MLIPYIEILKKYNFNPSGILHLGAHQAEEAEDYNKSGVKNVIWIEGNPELIPTLEEILKPFPNNKVLNLIVSDSDDNEIFLNVTNSTMSSSILDLAEHKTQHPGIDVVKKIRLKTTRLDTFIKNNLDLPFEQLDFLNIDIQGAELLAIKGLGDSIKNFKFIYTEINLAHLYENCPLLEDLDLYLGNHGFKRVETSITEWLWGDALYMKTEMTPSDIEFQVQEARELAKSHNLANKHKADVKKDATSDSIFKAFAKKILNKLKV